MKKTKLSITTLLFIQTLLGQGDYFMGGESTVSMDHNPHPWLVGILNDEGGDIIERLHCTGAIIAPQWIIATAQCVSEDSEPFSPEEIQVYYGTRILDEELENEDHTVAVDAIIRYPLFNGLHTGGNFALLKLSEILDEEIIEIIPLVDDVSLYSAGEAVSTSNWVPDNEYNAFPDYLWVLDMLVYEDEALQEANGDNWVGNDVNIFAGNHDASPCFENSSSPLFTYREDGSEVLIGFAIKGANTACGDDGFYLGHGIYPVFYNYLGWINMVIQEQEALEITFANIHVSGNELGGMLKVDGYYPYIPSNTDLFVPLNSDLTIHTFDEFLPEGTEDFKHHHWNDDELKFRLITQENLSEPREMIAKFIQQYPAQIGSNVPLLPVLEIRDPWYIEPDGENAGEQLDDFHHIESGEYDVFVEEEIEDDEAYYSMRIAETFNTGEIQLDFNEFVTSNVLIDNPLDNPFDVVFSIDANLAVNYTPLLHLNSGQNLVSFLAIQVDNSIGNILNENTDYVTQVIGEGIAADYIGGGSWVGSLEFIEYTGGYWVNSYSEFDMPLLGEINNFETMYHLHEGANLISYPNYIGLSIEDAMQIDMQKKLSGIIGEGVAASNLNFESGDVPVWVGSLVNFSPNRGYWFKAGEDFDLSFYPPTEFYFDEVNRIEVPELFSYHQSTNQAFYFVETAVINGEPLSSEDWIVTYSGDTPTGARQWNGNTIDVPAMGVDDSEWTTGYLEEGDTPIFTIYDASVDSVYFTIPPDDDLTWENLKFYTIQNLEAVIPDIPQNITVGKQGNHPIVTWSLNGSAQYNIWTKYTSVTEPSFWFYRASTSDSFWIDTNVTPGNWDKIYYKVTAENSYGNISLFSETVHIKGDVNHWSMPRDTDNGYIPDEYRLFPAFPNPFNPVITNMYDSGFNFGI